MITLEQYVASMGSPPPGNELERCNCPLEGSKGHRYCGWCPTHNKPRAMCGCSVMGKEISNDDPSHDFCGIANSVLALKDIDFTPKCKWATKQGKVTWCHSRKCKKYFNGPCSKRCLEAEE